MRTVRCSVFFGVIILVLSCIRKNPTPVNTDSNTMEFAPYEKRTLVEDLKQDNPLYRLNTIDSIKTSPKIDYKVRKLSWTVSENGKSFQQTTIEVKFPSLTPQQCLAVRAAYGNRSRIRCLHPGEYTLADFMPPSIQATNNNIFRDETVNERLVQTNCWSTAYEILRQDHLVYLHTLMEENFMKDAITKNSTNKHLGDRNATEKWIKDNAEFLDAILVLVSKTDARMEDQGFGIGSLLHAAVIIDRNGLIFERKGIAGPDGFHFIDFKSVSMRGEANFQILRPNKPMPPQWTLPTGWKLSGQGCVRIPFEDDANGRSKLPAWTSIKGELQRAQREGPGGCLDHLR